MATPQGSLAGCLPGSNCIVRVPEDLHVAVERFGMFRKLLRPGIGFAGLDICGTCVKFRAISAEEGRSSCSVPSRTRDGEFVTAKVEVLHSVIPQLAGEAIYKLAQRDAGSQIESFVSTAIGSFMRNLDLEEVLGRKDEIAVLLHEQLSEYMQAYGLAVHRTVVTELEVSPEVARAVSEVIKQRRRREAADALASAKREQRLQVAEAGAQAAALHGEEVARQCAAMIEGLGTAAPSQSGFMHAFGALQHSRIVRETGAEPLPLGNEPEAEELEQLLRGGAGGAGGAGGLGAEGLARPEEASSSSGPPAEIPRPGGTRRPVQESMAEPSAAAAVSADAVRERLLQRLGAQSASAGPL